tara:strand:+ start:15886 stop:17478 length:1593 start_codon:yes stop_codon:yes gene_type:complete
MTSHYTEKNTLLLNHYTNVTFEEIRRMNDVEFREWVIEMRKAVSSIWDDYDLPPRVGLSKKEINQQFWRLSGYPVHEFECTDEITGDVCIRNTQTNLGTSAVNAWFPTMMKTRINYKAADDGKSIYDHFVDDALLEKVITYAKRHFHRDSFYHYSIPMKANDGAFLAAKTGLEWITEFENSKRQLGTHGYWIEPKKADAEYTGYNEDLKNQKYLELTATEIEDFAFETCVLDHPYWCETFANYDPENLADRYQIRLYKYGQKIFPLGFKAFRISWCQYAVNFPPLTAKYLYERYLPKGKSVVWDPSAGWGGRIIGAMSCDDDYSIHYIGCDPNSDHTIVCDGGRRSTKYENVAEHYNKIRNTAVLFPHENTFEIFQCGSEEMQNLPEFQKHKGKVDLVFTSPPYFAKEAYSEDEEQSYKKFRSYPLWRDGFLYETFKTAWEWLQPDSYLLWNIADAKFGKDILPLEQDSIDIATKLGFVHVDTLKMVLAQMPGGNRIDSETGLPKAKNFCKVNGMWFKYEPILIFRKILS